MIAWQIDSDSPLSSMPGCRSEAAAARLSQRHMKTVTVSQLRKNWRQVLEWVANGEEVELTLRGKVVAKIVPPSSGLPREVDWSKSAALNRRRSSRTFSVEQSAAIRAESGLSDELH
jgi:antitoxin (DNA-binding transcriptional repressor) of toxin-antitoxin stability system